MPEHIVVRCYSCQTHQAVQRNKKQKFDCKLCGAKQSVKAVLASGTAGKELREVVQQLNYTKGKEVTTSAKHGPKFHESLGRFESRQSGLERKLEAGGYMHVVLQADGDFSKFWYL
ncbi:mrnip [Symbiodinium natans]|uniref:Mrnip protein n=1 Tax=Symbiodinium natans TaxID=878477 RepID=A0A812LKP2_9DINO|nr:mrnip [Symbiodinium natans]